MRCMIAEILMQRDFVRGPIAADQVVAIMIHTASERSVIKRNVTLQFEALDRAFFGINMDAIAELVEENVISDQLCPTLVLSIDSMTMPAIRRSSLPPVVVDQAAINFRINSR